MNGMALFELNRIHDATGVSGTGHVADGAVFPDGVTVVRWRGASATTTVHASMESVRAVHLHGGATEIRWIVLPDVDGTPIRAGTHVRPLTEIRGEAPLYVQRLHDFNGQSRVQAHGWPECGYGLGDTDPHRLRVATEATEAARSKAAPPPEEGRADLSPSVMEATTPLRVAAWSAVNAYVEACGGYTGPETAGSVARQEAASRVADVLNEIGFVAASATSEGSCDEAIRACVQALSMLADIIGESKGVAGLHLNGDVAEWSEFEAVGVADDALYLARTACLPGTEPTPEGPPSTSNTKGDA